MPSRSKPISFLKILKELDEAYKLGYGIRGLLQFIGLTVIFGTIALIYCLKVFVAVVFTKPRPSSKNIFKISENTRSWSVTIPIFIVILTMIIHNI